MVGSLIREVRTIYTFFLFPLVPIPRWDEDQVTVSFYLEARRPCAIGQPVPVSTSFFVCRNLTWSLLRYLPPIQLFIFFFFPLIFYPLCFSDGRRSELSVHKIPLVFRATLSLASNHRSWKTLPPLPFSADMGSPPGCGGCSV